ncbi:endonuclease/exonuclease/phosphatase family protein [Ulvibacter antarcticus]|uniref:Endonuclease/exonuclease/phosphatase domain-containing protein n=1 Tax=Ulvibacter antarcticus TaxID=442714 RepID=A0A3L9Z1D8_9FLAO|nr:endonuclease [Ulvibacter antarcticus]RMA65837.1 hypothetical protein BXY75_0250 [Ulvibacter antarcticus]
MSESSEENINNFSIAFYNLENLFDTLDDPKTMDDDFTSTAKRKWNEKRFRKKIRNLGFVIKQIGYSELQHPPVLIGVAEVENAFVLQELVNSKFLKKKEYDFIHFDSPDERGIDTALIYRKEYFKVIHKEAVYIYVENNKGVQDFTRDILYVKGLLDNEEVHILVNHWPSRRAGVEKTNHRRLAVSAKNKELTKQILSDDPNARIIIMGDFNDDPQSESVKNLTESELYNPMELLLTRYDGSTIYRGAWNLFDQIIITNNFLQLHGNDFRFKEAKIFNPESLREFKGRNKGNPFRTFMGRKYIGGFSDHFPVYGIFSIRNKI